MKRLLFLVLLAACSSTTAPSGGADPTVLITNRSAGTIVFTWHDGQGIVGGDSIPSGMVGRCERFTARPDSAYFAAVVSDGHGTSTYQQPWFDSTSRPSWTMTVTPNTSGSPLIYVADTAVAC